MTTEAEIDAWRDSHGTEMVADSCCGADSCYRFERSTPEQPCWGAIMVVDEVQLGDDYCWVHACEGHRPQQEGDEYLPREVIR